MALSNSQYESIMRVYNRTQLQKKHELDARVDEVYEKIPVVREMNDAIAASMMAQLVQVGYTYDTSLGHPVLTGAR
mgnify:FL=1